MFRTAVPRPTLRATLRRSLSACVAVTVLVAAVLAACGGPGAPAAQATGGGGAASPTAAARSPTPFEGTYGGYFGYVVQQPRLTHPDLVGVGSLTVSGTVVRGEVAAVSGKRIGFQGTIAETGELALTADAGSGCRVDQARARDPLSVPSLVAKGETLSGPGFVIGFRCAGVTGQEDYSELVAIRGVTPRPIELSDVAIDFVSSNAKASCLGPDCLAGVVAHVDQGTFTSVRDTKQIPLGKAVQDPAGGTPSYLWEDGTATIDVAASKPAADLGSGAFRGEQRAQSLLSVKVSREKSEFSASFVGKGSAQCSRNAAGLASGGFEARGGFASMSVAVRNDNAVDRSVDVKVDVSANGLVSNARWHPAVLVEAAGETRLKIELVGLASASRSFSESGTVRFRVPPGTRQFLLVRRFDPFVGIDYRTAASGTPCPATGDIGVELKVSVARVR